MSNHYNKCCSQKQIKCKQSCDKENGIKFSTVTAASSGLTITNSILLPVEDHCSQREFIVNKAQVVCQTLVKVRTDAGDNFFTLDNCNRLVSFDAIDPIKALYYGYQPQYNDKINVRPIVGLLAGQTAIDIDFRPSNGKLYLLANGAGGAHLYILDTTDPCKVVATPVGQYLAEVDSTPVALVGTEFSIDFDPVLGFLQIISNTGQNLVVEPDTGITIVLPPLAYIPGDINFQRTPVIQGIAFTNSVPGAVSTSLYVIDIAQNVLALANTFGSGLNTVGPLGFVVSRVIGFDIQPGTNLAYAILTAANGLTGLYIINLATGAARLVQCLDIHQQPLRGLAVVPSAINSSFNITLLNNNMGTAISAPITISRSGLNCFTINNTARINPCDRLSVLVTANSPTGIPAAVEISLELC